MMLNIFNLWFLGGRGRRFLNHLVLFVAGVSVVGVFAAPGLMRDVSFLGYSVTSYFTAGLTGLIIVTLLINFAGRIRAGRGSMEPEATRNHRATSLLQLAGVAAASFGLLQIIWSLGSFDEPRHIQPVVAFWLLLAGTVYFSTVDLKLNSLVVVLIGSGAVSSVLIYADITFSWGILVDRGIAMYLLAPLALSLYRGTSRPAQWALPLGIFSAISGTSSRTATVTALIIFVAYLALMRRPRLPQRIWLSASAVALFSAFLLFNATVRDRFQVNSVIGASLTDNSTFVLNTNGRSKVWAALLEEALLDRPLLGGGAGASKEFVTEKFSWDHPHSEYLRIFTDFGIVGLMLFLIILGSLGLYFSRALPGNREPAFLGIVSLISVAFLSATDLPLVSLGFVLPLAVVISVAIRQLRLPAG